MAVNCNLDTEFIKNLEQNWSKEGEEKEAYTEDVRVVQDYAELNRQIIVREILKGMKWKASEQFSVVHNYLDDSGMLRKGAVAAEEGIQVIIPANMRDGVILGIGLGYRSDNGDFEASL